MPANNYPYDPTGQAAANRIVDEVHDVNTNADISVWPLHGPVYAESVKVESLKSGAWVELDVQVDYVFSPMFLSISASTAKDAISYILLLEEHTKIRITYQIVGMYEDEYLLQEILGRTDLDRSSLRSWLSIRGQQAYWEVMARNPKMAEHGLAELLVQEIQKLRVSIANPYTSDDNLGAKVSDIDARLGQLTNDVNSFIATRLTETPIEANTVTDIYVSMAGDDGVVQIRFVPDDDSGRYSTIAILLHHNNLGDLQEGLATNIGGLNVTLSHRIDTGRLVVRALTDKKGTFFIKPLNVS